ncbi:MAG: hypothetical protein IJM97_07510, partial [Clostridia bacterium]|nr:hypothetical protein [Clostridia bacterium]
AGEFKNIYSSEVAEISGTHDLYFVFSDKNISFRGWTFAEPSGDEPTSEPTEDTTDEPHIVKGDVNADDVFDVADVVMMQNYLINSSKLVNADVGDLSGDNVLDVFDVILMRRQLS